MVSHARFLDKLGMTGDGSGRGEASSLGRRKLLVAVTKRWTIEELERGGGPNGRWELIDGEIVPMTPVVWQASATNVAFGGLIGNHVRPRRFGELYSADLGVVPFPGRETVRVPSGAFLRSDRVPPRDERDGFLTVAPDLVWERASPFAGPDEVTAKAAMWPDAGVRLVWVVDAEARTVAVHASNRPVALLGEDDDLDGGAVLPGFRVPVRELFVPFPSA